jgi:hypothetical protein
MRPISLVARDGARYNTDQSPGRTIPRGGAAPAARGRPLCAVSRRGNPRMFRRLYPWMLVLVGVVIGVVAAGGMAIHAQEREQPGRRDAARPVRDLPEEGPAPERRSVRPEAASPGIGDATRSGTPSAQDVLLRPYRFTFSRPTSLALVCIRLKESLGVPVVLDVAALGRQDVDPEDTVQLELDGVRLKTGLKLLLDQVGMTFHVVPEDNLIIITDREGSEDPLDRIWNELRALHRDLHDVQDAVDDLTDALFDDKEEGPRVRKPTIIEEKPENDPLPQERPSGRGKDPKDSNRKPGAVEEPVPRSGSPRVPLSRRRRSL